MNEKAANVVDWTINVLEADPKNNFFASLRLRVFA